jgi:hypothetical protein
MSKPKKRLETLASSWDEAAKACMRVGTTPHEGKGDAERNERMIARASTYQNCAESLRGLIAEIFP